MNLRLIKSAVPVLKGIGRATGVLSRTKDGKPVTLRSARLTASMTALFIALLSHFGLPEEIAQPLAEILVELGSDAVQ